MYKVYKSATAKPFTALFEVWKDVLGMEDSYSVSSFGRVWSKPRVRHKVRNGKAFQAHYKGKIMSPKTDQYGYKVLGLYGDRGKVFFSVHRLVATAFIKGDTSLTVNHLDGHKINNKVSNLEWSTNKEQMRHALECNLISPRGHHIYSPSFKRKVKEYFDKEGCSLNQLAEHFKISKRSASRWSKGETETQGVKIADCQIDNIISMRERGLTLKAISIQMGCGISQIHRILNGKSRNIQYEV